MVQLAMKGKIFKNTYKNKHNIEHELQQYDGELNEENEQSLKQCDVNLNGEFEKDTNYHDFRTMPRVMKKSSMKAGVKRLQEGPKNAKKKVEQRSLAGKTLRKLIARLTNEIPEVKIGEEVKRKQRLDIKMRKKEEPSSSLEEDCLTLLSGMSLY